MPKSTKRSSSEESTVFTEMISDLVKRERQGWRSYKRPMRPFNGRDALQESYEESLDLAAYLKQLLMERQDSAKTATHLKQLLLAKFRTKKEAK